MKPTGCNWSCRLYPWLTAALSLFTLVTLVWAVDKHLYAGELQDKLAQQHREASEQHQQLAELVAENRELKSRLAEYQRRDGLKTQAALSGESLLIEHTDKGLALMQQPNGAVRLTAPE
ncbi:hypothetical protein [Ferrimonas marina]|uniref:Uncharacterized protein n=1 Tax=Ferrimonas marina TaxID=299255 RepID=A0A1M5YE41_9GAMM|nr:hypothetical protein [Ferrimonas marina]SHI10330.1 hypothetical protein SAMN02745129_4143 [Ferrimonas marina]